MGWFTNNDEDKNKRTNGFSSQFTSSETVRQCRQDDNDQNFLICRNKTTTSRWIDGKQQQDITETEERVPVKQPPQDDFDFNSFQREFDDAFNSVDVQQNFQSIFSVMWPFYKIFNQQNNQPHSQQPQQFFTYQPTPQSQPIQKEPIKEQEFKQQQKKSKSNDIYEV